MGLQCLGLGPFELCGLTVLGFRGLFGVDRAETLHGSLMYGKNSGIPRPVWLLVGLSRAAWGTLGPYGISRLCLYPIKKLPVEGHIEGSQNKD